MTATDDFFAELEGRGHEPMLRRLSATVRWDILDGDRIEHRLVRVPHGDVRGAGGDGPADCVIVAEREVCDDVVTGRTSALAALLRGAAAVDGEFELMVLGPRLFPRTPGASAGRAVGPGGGRQS